MEAASRLRPRRRHESSSVHELQRLRPFGEAYLMRNFGDRIALADAEDAVSDVTLRLHRQIASGRAPDNLQGAFLTGCRNAAIDRLRRRARKPTVGLEAAANAVTELPSPNDHAEHGETAARTREVLARLRPRHRKALMLRFGAGMTVPEVAARMQVTQPAAKNVIARATEQARRNFEAIEARHFCPEVQSLVRGAVVDNDLAELADEDERRTLHTHLEHCGACKSFLADLHRNLHELGSGALLAVSLTQHSAPLAHLPGWLDHAVQTLHSGAARVRLTAFKLGGAFNGDLGAGGALAGTTQKALAVCGAATATTATCLATGLLGPGIGALDHHQADPAAHHHGSGLTRRLTQLEPAPPQPETDPGSLAEAAPSPSETKPTAQPEPEPEPTPSPAQQSAEEFGVESTAPPPEPEPASQPAPSSSTPARSSGGGGGAGGGESFGFGG